jgi:hypothetical protein
VNGSLGKNRNKTLVVSTKMRPTELQIHPTGSGSTKERFGYFWRPCVQLTAIGMAYERPIATTAAEEIAFKTLLDTRKTQPSTISNTAVRHSTFIVVPRPLLTLANCKEGACRERAISGEGVDYSTTCHHNTYGSEWLFGRISRSMA